MANLFDALGLAKAIGSSGSGTKEDASLLVNGKSFSGWTSISIKRSIKTLCGSFDLTLIDKWAQEQTPWLIAPNDECVLKIGDEILITGYVDSVQPSFSSTQRSVTISGRDKSADLVDCSTEIKPGNWENISLERLAKLVCAPFGVAVTNEVTGLKPFLAWRIQPGETGFETLDRAAKLSGVLLVNDGAGGIVITRASTDRASTRLVQGVNILTGSANFDTKDRFSNYTVKGQNEASYSDASPETDFQVSGKASDAGIKRFRPLTIISEGAATLAICTLRAQWEATFRAAKSSKVNVVVYGWRQENGMIWAPNTIVNLDASFLGVRQDFIISSVNLIKSSSGTTTALELERPDAYTPDPTLKTRKDPFAQLVKEDRARR